MPLLEVRNLSVRFGAAPAVDGVSFGLAEGQTLALVGESGCGKTLTALSVLRLTPPTARVSADAISLRDRELTRLSGREMRGVRGKEVGVVFQDPLTALNPVWPVGEQVAEGLRLHEGLSRRAAWGRAVEALREVGIADPARRASEYPHQLSGGMRQRAMIAAALACRPPLLIADEPTTALDVTLQAQIIDLLLRLREERRLTILLITHDLGVVAELAHRVAVMYAGQVVESADAATLFRRPLHPYTRALLAAVPRLDGAAGRRLAAIDGTVPDPTRYPPGCRFAPRCPHALEACGEPQELREWEPGHLVRCGRAGEGELSPLSPRGRGVGGEGEIHFFHFQCAPRGNESSPEK
jgi:peptide/nickel transport system ATP-binding protein/oligopeptide transport system ATP-binding protein